MNQKTSKRLRKVLLEKTSAVLLLVREHYGETTGEIETPQAVWRRFKDLYKQGKVPPSLFTKSERSIELDGNNIKFE
jgi:hypothetical protein